MQIIFKKSIHSKLQKILPNNELESTKGLKGLKGFSQLTITFRRNSRWISLSIMTPNTNQKGKTKDQLQMTFCHFNIAVLHIKKMITVSANHTKYKFFYVQKNSKAKKEGEVSLVEACVSHCDVANSQHRCINI